MPETPAQNVRSRPLLRSVGRGLMCKCPNCGQGRLFNGFLEQVENCATCGEPLGRYQAGLLLALVVGMVVVFVFSWIFLGLEIVGGASPGTYLSILVPTAAIVSMLVLRPAKGAIIGFIWSLQANDELQR